MKQIISCVWVGNAYPEIYVERLYSAIKRYTTIPFDFVVIGDKKPSNKDILWWGPKDIYPKWWSKLILFNPYFIQHLRCNGYTHNLFFDLDTMIVDNIDDLFYLSERFTTLRNFLQPPIRNPSVTPCLYGSAVMSFNLQYQIQDIWQTFRNNPEFFMKTYEKDGDQWFIERHLDNPNIILLQDIFVENLNYFRSIKYPENLISVPENCHILCYHGNRKMDKEIDTEMVKNYWID